MSDAMGEDQTIPLGDRLDGLTAFLPIFEADRFTFGAWKSEEGVMPMYLFSNDASRFIDEAYRLGWVLPDFEWMTWKRGEEAQQLLADPAALDAADATALARLLTAHIRQERFCEGHLAVQFERGHLMAILRRLQAIREEGT